MPPPAFPPAVSSPGRRLLFACSLARSLDSNQLCGLGRQYEYIESGVKGTYTRILIGTYTAECITAIAEMLKKNTTLQSIR